MAAKFTLDSREVLATNGLIAGEMRHLFEEMFAGRGLEPIPTPAEFAARRKQRRRGNDQAKRSNCDGRGDDPAGVCCDLIEGRLAHLGRTAIGGEFGSFRRSYDSVLWLALGGCSRDGGFGCIA